MKVLIVPDKFKGTLTADEAAEAMARGWRKARPQDVLELLPMSDGGDGFGEVMSGALQAKPQKVKTVNAAHQPCMATWWWETKTRTAIIEAARVNGLAMLPPGKFHPFKLDTFGLGAVLRAAEQKGAKKILVGLGGSATNDGGFGMARGQGWKFFDQRGNEIERWTALSSLAEIYPPPLKLTAKLIVAVDVQNPLLGPRGATRVYGPQKGMRPKDFTAAERSLTRLAKVARKHLGRDFAKAPGAGAAGGLGFGLLAFGSGQPEPGFEIFAHHAKLKPRLRAVDLVITGEGAIDRQTLMGKGVGRLAQLCVAQKISCIGLAGGVAPEARSSKLFSLVAAMTDWTTATEAKTKPTQWLARLAERTARCYRPEHES